MRKGVRRNVGAGIGVLLAALSVTATIRLQPTLALFTRQTTIAGNTFATASAFCSGQRTLTFLTGFEFGPTTGLGPFDGAQTAGGTPVVDTIRRNGVYAAKIAKGAGGASSLTKTTSGPTLVVRFAVLLESLP